jgi:thiol-disulfide isomerase/thioredoxin
MGDMTRFLVICLFAMTASGQVVVRLRLDTTTPTGVEHGLFCSPDYDCGIHSNEASKQGTFGHSTTPIGVERDGIDFIFTVRKGLVGEKKTRIPNGRSVIVTLAKRVAPGRYVRLPYEVTHSREESKGQFVDSFSMRAHYVVRGTFDDHGCSMDIALNDIRAEGKFDLSNADAGTNLQIDRNRDGKFGGRGEFAKTSEVVELCGHNYLVSALSFSRIIFRRTSITLARVGEKAPDFSLSLLSGASVSQRSEQGHAYVLDFWASWCAPCVASLPHVKELREHGNGRIDVYSINVDKASARKSAIAIVAKNELNAFTSVRGLGDQDNVWQMFGGGNQNHLVIPLYVLIDKDSVVRYIGNGGEGLVDLKNALEKISPQ